MICSILHFCNLQAITDSCQLSKGKYFRNTPYFEIIVYSQRRFQRFLEKSLTSRFLLSVLQNNTVSIYFTRLWSVRKTLICHTQNPEISGYFLNCACVQIQNKIKAKMKQRQRKINFLLI